MTQKTDEIEVTEEMAQAGAAELASWEEAEQLSELACRGFVVMERVRKRHGDALRDDGN